MSTDSFQKIIDRLISNLKRDVLIQKHLHDLKNTLDVDRVALYYFYRHWQGQITCEALQSEDLSILGSTGPDDCFNAEYAVLYEAGRARAIADIEIEPIATCHRDFLRSLKVRANLVVPILTARGLWGLLIAHQCRGPRAWMQSEIEFMQQQAQTMALIPAIGDR
ncbi:MAG: GAF domain-containing protein [Actinomycetota bacterium]